MCRIPQIHIRPSDGPVMQLDTCDSLKLDATDSSTHGRKETCGLARGRQPRGYRTHYVPCTHVQSSSMDIVGGGEGSIHRSACQAEQPPLDVDPSSVFAVRKANFTNSIDQLASTARNWAHNYA